MRLLLGGLCVAFGLTVFGGTAFAQPQIPATFFGSVTVDGKPAAAGLDVRAFVNGQDCTQAAPGERPVIRDGDAALYVLSVVHESQRPGCARDGAAVTFTIGGRAAVQSAKWTPGPNHLDISTGAAPPIPLPSPTGTIGAIIATATSEAVPSPAPTLARPTGAPPTDDVTFPMSTVGPPGQTPANETAAAAKDDGAPLLGIIAGVLAVLGVAGAAGGFALSRRRGKPGA